MSEILRLAASGGVQKPVGIVAPFLYTGDGVMPRVLGSGVTGVTWTPSLAALWRRFGSSGYPIWAEGNAAMQTNAGGASLTPPPPAFVPGGIQTTFSNINAVQYAGYVWRQVRRSFSMLVYTGDGTGARWVDHNLGAAPDVMFFSNPVFSGSATGRIYWRSQGAGVANTWGAAGAFTSSTLWDSTHPTATQVRVGTDANALGVVYRLAMWHWDGFNVAGGTHTGTGGALSLRVCGFRPRMLIFKRVTGGTFTWGWMDDVRDATNPHDRGHNPGATSGDGESVFSGTFETAASGWQSSGLNVSGSTYIWMAMR